MMSIIKKAGNIKIVFILMIMLFGTSCALKPIVSEYTFIKKNLEKVDLEKLGDGNVLIYNGANIFHKIDNTARLNIWINNRALGQIKPSEYVIINLKKGNYKIKLLHIDLVNIRSNHDVIIDNETKIIKVKPTFASNKLEIINELPKNFNKFKYAGKKK